MKPLGVLGLGLFSTLLGATDGAGDAAGLTAATGAVDRGLMLTAAGLGAGGTCDSLARAGGGVCESERAGAAAAGATLLGLFVGSGGGPPDEPAGAAEAFAGTLGPGATEPRAEGAGGGCLAGGCGSRLAFPGAALGAALGLIEGAEVTT